MMTATSVTNTNLHRTATWCSRLHHPFPPYFNIWLRNKKSVTKQLYYMKFYLFMDVLKEIAFTVPPASHSCNKISKHNTSWSTHIFLHIYLPIYKYMGFLQSETAACVWAPFSWIHRYAKSLTQNERKVLSYTLYLCSICILHSRCPRQWIQQICLMNASKLAQDTNINIFSGHRWWSDLMILKGFFPT